MSENNYKVFRISDRKRAANDKLGWFKSAEYQDNDIQEIQDPAGGTSKRQITSIPSPFARLDLIKTAFYEVSSLSVKDIKKLHGNSIYHKMVSDALDIGEIFFNKDNLEDIQIVTWDKNEDLNSLLPDGDNPAINKNGKPLSPSHKLLGETIQMFLDQDKDAYNFDLLNKFYLIKYKHQLIGGTSPATLFFSSANKYDVKIKFGNDKVLDDKYNPLYNRDPDFQKFLYGFFTVYKSVINTPRPNIKGDTGRMSELQNYLDRNLEYLRIHDETLYNEIMSEYKNEDIFNETEYSNRFTPLNVEQTSNNPIEVLGCELKHKKRSQKIVSDFIIKSDKYRGDKPPLVLQNDFTAKGYRYVSHEWEPGTKVPYVDELQLNSRRLPEQTIDYPYLTVSDFLEDYVIKLVYPLNTNKFFDGNLKFETDDKTGCLLPIKKEFFDYFDVDFLRHTYQDGKKVLEMKRTSGDAVFVLLRVPIIKKSNNQDKYIEFERIYHLNSKKIGKPEINKTQNDGVVLELQFGVNVFPFVKQTKNVHYRVMLADRDIKTMTKHNKYELQFYTNTGDSALPINNDERKTKIITRSKKDVEKSQIETQFYVIEKEFDYIELKNSFTSAIIIPEFKPVNGTDSFTFAVDFGTTNTHIEYRKNNEHRLHTFEVKEEDIQIATLHKLGAKIVKGATAIENIIDQEFVPVLIGSETNYQLPIRTAIAFTKGLDYRKITYPMADYNIAFTYEKKEKLNNADIITDLKWSNYSAGGAEEDIKRIRAYFENILLLIRSKVLLNGGDLEKTSLVWFYPSSMLPSRKDSLEDIWKELYKKYITDSQEPICISESTAPYYYYTSPNLNRASVGITASARPVVSIDIGGGTCDISIFKDTKLNLISSFKFGANMIYGDAYNSSPNNNGFIKLFKDDIGSKLEKNNDLKKVFDDITANRHSQDIGAFFFSLENNQYIIKNGIDINFNEMLKSNDKLKIVFLIYYSSIIYHIAKLMKIKGIGSPRYITFSGTGSKIINILGKIDRINQLTNIIFQKIYGDTEIEKVEIIQDDEPKKVTARGGVLHNKSDDTIDEYRNVLLGFSGDTVASLSNGFTYEQIDDDKHLSEVIENVESFIDTFFDINKDFNFKNYFGIDASLLDKYKSILKEDLMQFLGDGYNKKLEELGGNKTINIEESLFFYPLVGALNKLANEIASL